MFNFSDDEKNPNDDDRNSVDEVNNNGPPQDDEDMSLDETPADNDPGTVVSSPAAGEVDAEGDVEPGIEQAEG